MTQRTEARAILFADIAGSTGLYERLGDAAAKMLIDHAIGRMRQAVEHFGGTVVKTIGDEIMAAFPAPAAGADAALMIQNGTRMASPQGAGALGSEPLKIRIGFHFGPVILDNHDVFGDGVNVAARLTDAARAGQILTSEETIAHMPPRISARARVIDEDQLRGKSRVTRVFSLLWEAETELTRLPRNTMNFAQTRQQVHQQETIRLTIRDRNVLLEPEQMPLSLGRDAQCTLVVAAPLASRGHAKIEYRRGKFVITDHSTNGTYVMSDDGVEMFLKRESMPLVGRGVISLGCPLMEQTGDIVRFHCE